jgi:hypothetical protein
VGKDNHFARWSWQGCLTGVTSNSLAESMNAGSVTGRVFRKTFITAIPFNIILFENIFRKTITLLCTKYDV